MLSDGDIQKALESAMENQFSKPPASTTNFFSHGEPTGDEQSLTVSIHKWAIADVTSTDTLPTIKVLAKVVVKEVAGVSYSLTGEMVFGFSGLLPRQPLWTDEAPLFAARDADDLDRFGVPGGNITTSVGSCSGDVLNAIDRLVELDQSGSYDSDEKLRIFCSKSMERKLMRACAKVGANCRVFGMRGYQNEQSWVMSRDNFPCSMLMATPSFELPVKGTKMIAGSKYVVWINDPRLAVRVTYQE
jgi:hypothetical protein